MPHSRSSFTNSARDKTTLSVCNLRLLRFRTCADQCSLHCVDDFINALNPRTTHAIILVLCNLILSHFLKLNQRFTRTDWIDKEPAGSQPQASSLPQGSSSGPLSQDVNVSPTPSGSQTNPSSQPYQEPPSTPTPKRNFSTIDSNEKRQASSHKRLRIIQETLASPSPAEHPTATSSQNSKFKPAIGIASIQYDNPSGLVPQPSTPLRTSEPVASGSNEDPFQDSSVVARGDVVVCPHHTDTSVSRYSYLTFTIEIAGSKSLCHISATN